MNKTVLLICFIGFITGLYAEAPELMNVMPNSWRKVTKLTSNEERQFITENKGLFDIMKAELTDSGKRDNNSLPDPNFFFIYEQVEGNEPFFRIICTDIENPSFLSPQVRFVQFLVYKNRLVCRGFYNIEHITRYIENVFISIDIITNNGTVKGVLVSYLLYGKDDYLKNQIKGLTGSEYYLMDDLIKEIASNSAYLVKNCPDIKISASDCLVDPNISLRYSLQNAFDGDPNTSYVENTGDDLMGIIIAFPGLSQKLAIINGYAANENLYKANNRIKTVTRERFELLPNGRYSNVLLGDNYTLRDSDLTFQILDYVSNGYIWVTDIFKGNKYNDTCIAELNIKTDNGWLFGDIDE
ncbi:MAG: hypothetical protein LBU85_11120 [Treponema sp.]|jgi:hypothetical protein|nr:hypothetical protein [Treponema sp.]